MAFTTRVATAADYPVFARLFPELAVPDPVPTLLRFTTHMLPRVLLLYEDDQPLAYLFWQLYGRTAHVTNVVVDPSARGRGVGRALMDAARAVVVQAGCTRWYLNVKTDNQPAIRLYQRCGMAVSHTAWALKVGWSHVSALAGSSASPVITPAPSDDAAIAEQLALDSGRVEALRATLGMVLLAIKEQDQFVAFAAFDPTFPGAYVFRVARTALARPLLDACQSHANVARYDFIRLFVEKNAHLKEALCTAGAELVLELLQLSGSLGADL